MAVVRLFDDDAVAHYSQVGVRRVGDQYHLAHWVVTPENVHRLLSGFRDIPVIVQFQEVTIFTGEKNLRL
jgi:hypothetical protein